MKKKLLFSNVGHQWNALLRKFLKVQKKINAPDFSENYTIAQQRTLLTKLKNLYHRLLNMQHQVGVKIAGTAIGLMMIAATANAQYWQPTYTLESSLPDGIEGLKLDFGTVAAADIDGDGNADIIAGAYYGSTLVYFLGNGDGTFGDGQILQIDGENASIPWPDAAFADLDDDGDLDLAVGNNEDEKVYKFLNDGSLNFISDGEMQTFQGDPIMGTFPRVEFADLDGDSDMDLFVTQYIENAGGWQTGFVKHYTNNDGNYFYTGPLKSAEGDTIFTPWKYIDQAFSDYDLDGEIDLFLAMGGGGSQPRSKVILWENNESQFTEIGDLLDESDLPISFGYYNSIAFADIDNDGLEELVVLSGYGSFVGIKMYEYYEPGLAVKEYNSKELTVFPNPASEYLDIQGISKPSSVKIYDIAGNLVKQIENVDKKLNISSLSTGMYFLEVDDGVHNRYSKFIKK